MIGQGPYYLNDSVRFHLKNWRAANSIEVFDGVKRRELQAPFD